MKLKLTMLTAFCLLLFACPSVDDDNVTTTIALTETNYIYENDLYRFSLEAETTALIDQIIIWEALEPGEPGYEEAQEPLENAINRVNEINEILEGLTTGAGLGFPPIPTPPPPPPPCVCFGLYNSLDFIIVDDDTIGLFATITNENQEEVFSTDLTEPLLVEDFQGVVKAYNFNALEDQFTGKGFLTINRVLANEDVLSYTIEVYVNNL